MVAELIGEFMRVSVIIPTYRRERVLINTIRYLLDMNPKADEIVVVDQTDQHADGIEEELRNLEEIGAIRRIRLKYPSIPRAMNEGLNKARYEIALFLDDDIRPNPNLLASHIQMHREYRDVLVAGRVIQPWHTEADFTSREFHQFCSTASSWIDGFMGGNFSLRRKTALSLGGFDENFVRVAYRFESEFAHRYLSSGRKILYEPKAAIHHLKEMGGGTRVFSRHLTTSRPDHAVGEYYFLFRTWSDNGGFVRLVKRPIRACITRFHARHPWYIPRTLMAELRGMIWAYRLHLRGARLINKK